MPPFRERFTFTVWFALLEKTIGNLDNYVGGGRASYLPGRRISFEIHAPPLKTIPASPECTNHTLEASVPIVVEC